MYRVFSGDWSYHRLVGPETQQLLLVRRNHRCRRSADADVADVVVFVPADVLGRAVGQRPVASFVAA